MEPLIVRWRGELYSVATCLSAERAEALRSAWPDRVIDLATHYDKPPGYASQADRDWMTRTVLAALGEPLPEPRLMVGLRRRLGRSSAAVSMRDHVKARAALPAPQNAAQLGAGAVRRHRP